MINSFLFQLGRERRLALAELAALIGEDRELTDYSPQTVIVELTEPWTAERLQDRLGGTVRIGRVLTVLAKGAGQSDLFAWLTDDLLARPSRDFGLSLFDGVWRPKQRDRLGLALKRKIKEAGRSARFVGGEQLELSSVLVRDQLLGQGREYLIVWTHLGLVISETVTIQASKNWSRRDFDRPIRDTRRGMLPPKLARILVNLGRFPSETTLLDPFCGVGTVLQEAAVIGYRNLVGTDRDDRALAATRQNLEWLKQQWSQVRFSFELLQTPLENLHKMYTRSQARQLGIATEADLGPSDLATKPIEIRRLQFGRLTAVYEKWLLALFDFLKPGERCVLAYPLLREPETPLPIVEMAERSGWRVQAPLPDNWHQHPATKERKMPVLVYARPDQLIGRQIVILEKP